MASGYILGECWICEELIWEDEDWTIHGDELIHTHCFIVKELEKEIKIKEW